MKRLCIFILIAVMLLSLSSCFMLPTIESMEWGIFTVADGDADQGYLIPVHDASSFVPPANTNHLGVIADTWMSHATAQYQYSGLSTHMDAIALKAMDNMLTDFAKSKNNTDLLIGYAYVTPEKLGDLPADHLTGFGCQLKYTVIEEDGSVSTHDLSENPLYDWLTENCYRYGFVVRYPADKTDKTGVSDYTDYFRYVGTPHAEYMMEKNLCLEEYVELLKGYNHITPLNIHCDGKHYRVYYADVSASPDVLYPAYHTYTYTGVGNNGIVVVLQD